MRVRVLSGLKLTMHSDPASGPNKRRWSAKTDFSNVLTSKYQVSISRFEKISKYMLILILSSKNFITKCISTFCIIGGLVGH